MDEFEIQQDHQPTGGREFDSLINDVGHSTTVEKSKTITKDDPIKNLRIDTRLKPSYTVDKKNQPNSANKVTQHLEKVVTNQISKA